MGKRSERLEELYEWCDNSSCNCSSYAEFKVISYIAGIRGEDSLAVVREFGEKFIGVEKGGVLAIHGERRPSWTKLQTTPTNPSKQITIFKHKVSRQTRWFFQ